MNSPFDEDEDENENDNMIVKEMDENSVFGKYYISICEFMKENKVPRDRIPSFVHFMSKAFSCINEDKINKWVENYIENEKTDVF